MKIKRIFIDGYGGPTVTSIALAAVAIFVGLAFLLTSSIKTHTVNCYSNGNKVVDITVVGRLHTTSGTPYINSKQGKVLLVTGHCTISSVPVK